jgi:Ca2+-binding EF-hand superfamily protein
MPTTTTTNEVNAINKINADKLGSFEIEDLRIRGYLAFWILLSTKALENIDWSETKNAFNTYDINNDMSILDKLLSVEKVKEYYDNGIWSKNWVNFAHFIGVFDDNEKSEILPEE